MSRRRLFTRRRSPRPALLALLLALLLLLVLGSLVAGSALLHLLRQAVA